MTHPIRSSFTAPCALLALSFLAAGCGDDGVQFATGGSGATGDGGSGLLGGGGSGAEGAAGGDGGFGGSNQCPVGQERCDDECVDTNTDPQHCGDCATACDPGEVCDGGGQCALFCQPGLVDCEGTCIDPNTDEAYCGAGPDCFANPGEVCEDGEICDGSGVCALSCQAGLIDCDGTCVDPLVDETYCGAGPDCTVNAGVTCDDGEVCDGSGVCALSCQAGLIDCNGTCIDPLVDETYCGAGPDCSVNAGVTCDPGEVCNGAGVCELSCQAGLIDCNGTCIDPLVDETYCGAGPDCSVNAGVTCDPGEVCNGAGVCELSCQAGLIDCNGTCIDPNSNPDYCGAGPDCTVNAGVDCTDTQACNAGICIDLILPCQDRDFEDPAQIANWTLTGDWGLYSAAPVSGTPFPSQTLGTDGNAGATNPEASSATSSSFVLPGAFVFDSWSNDEGGQPWDNKIVEVSINGGATWNELANCQTDPSWPFCVPFSATWEQVIVPTGIFEGAVGQVRFAYDTIDDIDPSNEGWFIDNLSCAPAPPPPPVPQGLFAATGRCQFADELYELDPVTFVPTFLGFMGIGGVTGLATDGNTMWAMPDSCSAGDLWQVDPITAMGLPIGPTLTFQNPDVTWDEASGTLYGWNKEMFAPDGALTIVDPALGAVFPVAGPAGLPFSAGSGLAADGFGGLFFVNGDQVLYFIDPGSGAALPIGPVLNLPAFNIAAMTFHEGELYAVVNTGPGAGLPGPSELWVIDINLVEAFPVAPLPDNIDALVSTTPMP